jgi:hypothetical protein
MEVMMPVQSYSLLRALRAASAAQKGDSARRGRGLQQATPPATPPFCLLVRWQKMMRWRGDETEHIQGSLIAWLRTPRSTSALHLGPTQKRLAYLLQNIGQMRCYISAFLLTPPNTSLTMRFYTALYKYLLKEICKTYLKKCWIFLSFFE